jgi:hypothetical protein
MIVSRSYWAVVSEAESSPLSPHATNEVRAAIPSATSSKRLIFIMFAFLFLLFQRCGLWADALCPLAGQLHHWT